MISDRALQEFKTIWRDETGLEVADKEALDAAVASPRIFDVTCRPISKEWSAAVDPPSARPLTLADLKNCGAPKF